jgi:hypothetical protein
VDPNKYNHALSKLVEAANEFRQVIGDSQCATIKDLDDMEKRLTNLIKRGKPLDLTEVVKAGDELSAETQALDAAVKQNQPPTKD